MAHQSLGLYFHWPFCQHKCPYCHFFSVTNQSLAADYALALLNELAHYQPLLEKRFITSIYFGGGTPSLIELSVLQKIFTWLNQHLTLSPDCEITIEANPESLTPAKIKTYAQLGINRLSLGLQTLIPQLQETMNRHYSWSEIEKLIVCAQQSGLANINADLIFGLPGQTLTSWQQTLAAVAKLPVTHLALYSLELDHPTVWGQAWRQQQLANLPTSATDRAMYWWAKRFLAKNGWEHEEISNWARPGFAGLHNYNFWQGQDFLGIGASASSMIDQHSWTNSANLIAYQKNWLAKIKSTKSNSQLWPDFATQLSPTDQLITQLILNLRLIAGIPLAKLHAIYQNYRQLTGDVILPTTDFNQSPINSPLFKVRHRQLQLTNLGLNLQHQAELELLKWLTAPINRQIINH